MTPRALQAEADKEETAAGEDDEEAEDDEEVEDDDAVRTQPCTAMARLGYLTGNETNPGLISAIA